jgi:putative hydrolase of the HAD superfamily
MYTTIIFDFFDVIHTDPFHAWLKKHGIKDREPYDRAIGPLDLGEITIKEFFQAAHELSGLSLESIEEEFKNNDIIDPETIRFIKRLSQNYKVGLLSNAAVEEIKPLIDKHKYDQLFHYIMISSEIGLKKPAPEAFNHILEKLDSKAEETIFIDDKQSNADAAGLIGIKGVLFKDLRSLKTDLQGLGINT